MERKNTPQEADLYILAEGELAAFRQFLAVQNTIGAGMPAVNPASMATFMGLLDAFSFSHGTLGDHSSDPLPTYSDIKNELFKAYIDQLYQSLIAMKTSYGQPFPALYIAHLYGAVFLVNGLSAPAVRGSAVGLSDGRQYWYLFGYFIGFFNDPTQVLAPVWRDELSSLMKAWDQQPPANIILAVDEYPAVFAFEENVLGAGWTNIADVTQATAAVWTAQADTARAMLKPQTLGSEAYFFMLHLLVGLATGDSAAQTLAQQIVTAPTSSNEHPNYGFTDQVICLSLMFFVDQNGPYVWTNLQCQTFLAALRDTVVAQDAASQAIRKRLKVEIKKLQHNPNYPLLDPVNPTIPFDERKTDTLYALDTTRAKLSASPEFASENRVECNT